MNERETVPSEARRQEVELELRKQTARVGELTHEVKSLSRGTAGLQGELKQQVDEQIRIRETEKLELLKSIENLRVELDELNIRLRIHN